MIPIYGLVGDRKTLGRVSESCYWKHSIYQDIELSVKGNQLILEKASNESKLDKLFEGFDSDKYFSENKGKLEYDWGEIASKEVW